MISSASILSISYSALGIYYRPALKSIVGLVPSMFMAIRRNAYIGMALRSSHLPASLPVKFWSLFGPT
jgi:hypothetical protein